MIEALCVRDASPHPTLLGILTREDVVRFVRFDR